MKQRIERCPAWLAVFLLTSATVLLLISDTLNSGARGEETPPAGATPRQRPTMREFMGLDVHTVQFKPDLYKPVCRLLRDYHPLRWDVGDDPARATRFPMAANGVDWSKVYGSWTAAGFDADACIMFDDLPPESWKNPGAEARAYGEAFARGLGPSSKHPLVSSIEIGNEPAKYSADQYRTIFQAMAAGVRAGDSKLTIATCAVMIGHPDQWSKPLSVLAGLDRLYDVLNIHSYPFKEKWPTWRRSYPEDPSISFLKEINYLIAWRDAHAPGKKVWLTEFGYDSASEAPAANGPWSKWVGVTDEQQAQYIVRAFLVLSATDLDRAYLYFFNDKNEPQLHGASGITRNFQPKPAFHAMSHLYRTLGDYRFSKAVVRKEGELYCFEYESAINPSQRIYVAWSPTGEARSARRVLPLPSGPSASWHAERMPLTAGEPARVECKPVPGGVEVEVGPSPVFLWIGIGGN